MDNNIRIVPVQRVCIICTSELPVHDGTYSLAGRLCRDCIRMVREQVLREVETNPKIVSI